MSINAHNPDKVTRAWMLWQSGRLQNPKLRFPKTSPQIAKPRAQAAMRWPLHDDHNQQLASKECIVLRALAPVYWNWEGNAGEHDATVGTLHSPLAEDLLLARMVTWKWWCSLQRTPMCSSEIPQWRPPLQHGSRSIGMYSWVFHALQVICRLDADILLQSFYQSFFCRGGVSTCESFRDQIFFWECCSIQRRVGWFTCSCDISQSSIVLELKATFNSISFLSVVMVSLGLREIPSSSYYMPLPTLVANVYLFKQQKTSW